MNWVENPIGKNGKVHSGYIFRKIAASANQSPKTKNDNYHCQLHLSFPPFSLARAGAAIALAVIINQRARAAHGHAAAGAGDNHRETILREPASGNIVVRHFNVEFILNKFSESFHFLYFLSKFYSVLWTSI